MDRKGIMMRRFAAPLLAILVFCGCRGPQQASHVSSQDAVKRQAVRQSLDEFFQGHWDFGTVYIERGDFVPDQITRAGKYDAEVVSTNVLAERFRGKTVAPALARVRVYCNQSEPKTQFHVSVSYGAFHTEGATIFPNGGGRDYTYEIKESSLAAASG